MDVPLIGRWLRRLVIGLMALAAIVVLMILGAGWFIAPDEKLRKADAIVVVSGGDTVKRTEEGVRLYRDGWAPRLVFSGAAADRGTSNAAVMRNQAVAAGVAAADIRVEERSVNTSQNAEFLKPVFQAEGIRTAILVSSPYHNRRVKTTFRKQFGKGYTFIAHPAKDTLWARSSWWRQASTISLTWDELQKTFYVAVLQR